jgi:hypothetical protein
MRERISKAIPAAICLHARFSAFHPLHIND